MKRRLETAQLVENIATLKKNRFIRCLKKIFLGNWALNCWISSRRLVAAGQPLQFCLFPIVYSTIPLWCDFIRLDSSEKSYTRMLGLWQNSTVKSLYVWWGTQPGCGPFLIFFFFFPFFRFAFYITFTLFFNYYSIILFLFYIYFSLWDFNLFF